MYRKQFFTVCLLLTLGLPCDSASVILTRPTGSAIGQSCITHFLLPTSFYSQQEMNSTIFPNSLNLPQKFLPNAPSEGPFHYSDSQVQCCCTQFILQKFKFLGMLCNCSKNFNLSLDYKFLTESSAMTLFFNKRNSQKPSVIPF